ncbi:YaaL family protein [Weissella koreensis]|uniref:YaaL family protein n=1 Tax=Weissella koreensis TaxID=165096 RepID=UPI00021745C0|nr:YaaL family protein [Weissella koreensis]AEJ23738.1 hypothetical protein WKK_04325 [Weissella koreensis KACC 15510]AVH75357.1 DUF2508 domain-containing protein [Weissella koreensis]EJF34861.1 hypothetical protein JC2156_11730 [Weissella koreensis KCTC 3621]MCZ9311208.1 YaaL family protein [Weissella koreensis]QGN20583.1 DUF2508 family protein [Weissella koreensis]
MFGLKKLKLKPEVYDAELLDAIDDAKYDYEKAKASEIALFESEIDPRWIKAQTAFAKQKYFFLLRAARTRKMKGQWQRSIIRSEQLD